MMMKRNRRLLPGDLFDVDEAVLQAIQAANLKDTGAVFAPFKIKAGTTADFEDCWVSRVGDTPIVFYRYKGPESAPFLPLGDIAILNGKGFDHVGTLLIGKSSTDSDVLVHPTGFEWILDDAGSGNPRNISYWWPIAPPGYRALGLCFGESAPNPKKYWCVKEEYLAEVTQKFFWSDAGTRWKHHNGNLNAPMFTQQQLNAPSDSEVLLIVPTFFSEEGPRQAYALRAKPCYLNITPIPISPPSYDPQSGQGARTPLGVEKVAVLPFTTIDDTNRVNKPIDSPFYYLASEPYWRCMLTASTPEGGEYEVSYTVGTEQGRSESFKTTTSISVGINAGVKAGDEGGFEGGISMTFTSAFEITTEETVKAMTSTTDDLKINLPKQPVTQFWQKHKDFAVYSTSGFKLATAEYGMRDLRFVPTGV